MLRHPSNAAMVAFIKVEGVPGIKDAQGLVIGDCVWTESNNDSWHSEILCPLIKAAMLKDHCLDFGRQVKEIQSLYGRVKQIISLSGQGLNIGFHGDVSS
jgi:hypothetical protein